MGDKGILLIPSFLAFSLMGVPGSLPVDWTRERLYDGWDVMKYSRNQ